ncbi:NACHT domain-containing protein [Streptomyces sp. NPDC001970]
MRLRGREGPAHVENRFDGGSVGWLIQGGSLHIHLPPLTVRSHMLRLVGTVALGAVAALLLVQPDVLIRVIGALSALLALAQLVAQIRAAASRAVVVVPESRLTAAVALLAGRLRETYDSEERLARIHDPVPLRVRWAVGNRDVTDPWTTAPEPDGGDLADLEELFTRLPRGRLVVLGAAGAGKSVVALRLARVLLDSESAGRPLAVVLPIAGWDPTVDGPWRWAAARIAGLYPELGRTEPERLAVAEALLNQGRILPVLDGFDELPADYRGRALRELNAALGADRRLVLTSRPQEYADAVEATNVLSGATVVELCPLTAGQLTEFLPRTSRHTVTDGHTVTKWDLVLGRLRDPGSDGAARALRQALSTPLMVGLARAAYSDTDADPRDLLDVDLFPDRQAVEDHLLDAFVPAVYGIPLDDREARGPWSAAQAERWLGFLARHLQRTRSQELAWWRLDLAAPRLTLCAIPLASVALVVAALAWTGVAEAHLLWRGWPVWLPLSAWAVIGILAGAAATRRESMPAPRQLAFPRGWRIWDPLRTLSAPADTVSAASPWEVLRLDRRASLVASVAVPKRAEGELSLAEYAVLAGGLVVIGGLMPDRWNDMTPLRWALAITAWVAAAALCRVARSAWGRYVVTRTWLAATGRLGWRLRDFLEDAHRRGVLRQSGGVYLFRHAEVLDRMAGERVPAADRPRPVAVRARRYALVGLHGMAVGALVLVGVGSMGLLAGDPGPYRAPKTHPCSLLTVEELEPVVSGAVSVPVVSGAFSAEQEDGSCQWKAMGPGPKATLLLWVSAAGPDGRSSAVRAADNWVLTGGSPEPELTAVGDRAGGHVSDGSFTQATVRARSANAIVAVVYDEEGADRARVLTAAGAIAEQVLYNAHLGPEPDRPLAALPRPRPPAGSRFARYRDVQQRPLVGPVWQVSEHSEFHDFPPYPFVFRGPRMPCVQSGGFLAWTCSDKVDGLPRPVYGWMGIDVAECGGTACTEAQEERFAARFEWFGVKQDDDWKHPDHATTYTELTADSNPDEDWPLVRRLYNLQMLRTFAAGGKHYLLAFRMEIEPEYADVARKTLNDIVAQTSPATLPRP